MNKHIKIFICVIALSSFACTKEEDPGFEVRTPVFVSKTHDQLTVNVKYKFENFNNYLQGGIYWSESPDPSANDMVITDNNIKNEDVTFTLDDLNGNVTYYVKGWLSTPSDNDGNGGGLIFSDVASFTTEQTPDAPCAFNTGEVHFDFFTATMDSLYVMGSGPDYTEFRCDYDYGYIKLYFKEYPNSGIYRTDHFFTSLEDDQVTVVLYHQSSWTCVYETGSSYQNIHVINDGQGGLRINFCDLGLGTNGGCSPAGFTLDGEITN